MSKEIQIAPENLTVANTYLSNSDIEITGESLSIPRNKVAEILNKPEVKRYIDQIYLDSGYRNRFKLAAILDEQIDSKILEMSEAETTTKKDIYDLVALAHKMRMDEINSEINRMKANKDPAKTSINIAGASFGEGNYGQLMKELLIEGTAEECK